MPSWRKAKFGQKLSFQIEMACNRKFGARAGDERYKSIKPYILDQCDIALFDPLAWEICWDLFVLANLEKEINADGGAIEKSWGGELLSELNRFANAFDLDDRSTWSSAGKMLKALLKHKNADRTFELSAIGHAHIDTAWLWPLAETWRKCAAHLQFPDRIYGGLSGLQILLLPGLPVRHHQRAQSRPLPPHQGPREIRPVHPRRRHLDRTRLQHPQR